MGKIIREEKPAPAVRFTSNKFIAEVTKPSAASIPTVTFNTKTGNDLKLLGNYHFAIWRSDLDELIKLLQAAQKEQP